MIFALILLVLAFSENGQVGAVPRFFQRFLHPNSHTVLYNTRLPTSNSSFELNKRQELRRDNTCGFYDGDASKPRTAEPGFACRVDIKNGIWGFCPTSVIAATDCGLAGACVDSHACTDGCGIIGETTITTASCTARSQAFCSFAILTAGPDQVYSYIACGGVALTDNLLAAATTTSLNVVTSLVTPTQKSTPARTTPTTQTISSSETLSVTPTSSSSLVSSASSASNSASNSASLSDSQAPPSSVASDPTKPASAEGSSTTVPAPGSNNVRAIVGGVISAIALICFTVLGIIYLRKYRRDQLSLLSQTAIPAPPYVYRTTEAQTAGLHEKDGTVPVHETDGRVRPNIKKSRYTLFEMPG